MIGFGATLGWLALAALALPILIHLIRRQAQREVPFAALDFLLAHAPPRRQWRLDDRALLAVRLLLLVQLAALLAEPYWRSPGDPQRQAVYVVPGIDAAAARSALDAPLADWHWLAADAPALDKASPPADPAAFASLIRELDQALPAATHLSLVLPENLAALDGARLRLGRAVDWIVVPGTDVTSPDKAADPAAFRIAIRTSADTPAATTVARALVAAWRVAGVAIEVDEAAVGTPITDNCMLLIAANATLDAVTDAQLAGCPKQMVGSPEARSVEQGEVLLRDADGQPLLRRRDSGRGQVYQLAGPLDAAAWPPLRDPALPQALLGLLRPPVPPPDQAPAASVSPLRAAFDASGPAMPLASWLAIAIAALALLERLMATRKRRSAA